MKKYRTWWKQDQQPSLILESSNFGGMKKFVEYVALVGVLFDDKCFNKKSFEKLSTKRFIDVPVSFCKVLQTQVVNVLRDVGLTSQSELVHEVEFELQFEHECPVKYTLTLLDFSKTDLDL